jgi:hypothetical protein
MDDRDLFSTLSTGRFPSKEAAAYFSELRKSAGVRQVLAEEAADLGKSVIRKLKSRAGRAVDAGIGAGTGVVVSKASKEKPKEEKTAGIKELLGKGVQTLSNNKAPAIGAVIGAATATALQYMANKPGKDGKSKQRDMAEKSLAGHEKYIGDMKAKGKEPSYPDEMSHARAKSSVETSKVMEKHPLRSSLLATPGGALAGAGLGLATRKLLGG